MSGHGAALVTREGGVVTYQSEFVSAPRDKTEKDRSSQDVTHVLHNVSDVSDIPVSSTCLSYDVGCVVVCCVNV